MPRPCLPTETPLMLAAAAGSVRMTETLLSYGAAPFLSTNSADQSGGQSGTGLGLQASGSSCAVSIAASHGHKKVMNLLITNALQTNGSNPYSQHDPLQSSRLGGGGLGGMGSLGGPYSTVSSMSSSNAGVASSGSSNNKVMSLAEILAEGAEEEDDPSPPPPPTSKQNQPSNSASAAPSHRRSGGHQVWPLKLNFLCFLFVINY